MTNYDEKPFRFSYNPFDKDILGNPVEMPEGLSFEKFVDLKPDMSTLRHSALSSSGAFVIADPVNLDHAPRNKLKSKLVAAQKT